MDFDISRPIRLLERNDRPLHASDARRGLGRMSALRRTPSQTPGEDPPDYGAGVTGRFMNQGTVQANNNPGDPTIYRINSETAAGNELRMDMLEESTGSRGRGMTFDPPHLFDGHQPRHWLSMARHYYDYMGYSDERKVHAAVQRLRGEALDYWCAIEFGNPSRLPTNWAEFEKFILKRFSGRSVGTIIKKLQAIEYRGDVEDVANQFGQILSTGDSPPPDRLKSIFLGLFPYHMAMEAMRAQPETWVDVREVLMYQSGMEHENALEWFNNANENRRNEALRDPVVRREGLLPTRSFGREMQFGGDSGYAAAPWRDTRSGAQQDSRGRRVMGLELRTANARQAVIKCYNCGGEGHRTRDCPNARLEAKREGQRCRRCRGMGHWASACSTPSNYVPNDNNRAYSREPKREVQFNIRQGNGKV